MLKLDFTNYKFERLLHKGKNKKVIALTKDELGGKINTDFTELRPKTYSYLTLIVMKIKKQKTQNFVSRSNSSQKQNKPLRWKQS